MGMVFDACMCRSGPCAVYHDPVYAGLLGSWSAAGTARANARADLVRSCCWRRRQPAKLHRLDAVVDADCWDVLADELVLAVPVVVVRGL